MAVAWPYVRIIPLITPELVLLIQPSHGQFFLDSLVALRLPSRHAWFDPQA
jgi:hypothetical protein